MGGFKCFWFTNPKVLHTSADIHEDMLTQRTAGQQTSAHPAERRKYPRYSLVAPITVSLETEERLIESKGATVELSETGVSGYLRGEFESGQQVKVELALLAGPVIMTAVVRHKMGARYGFQFLDLPAEHAQKIRTSCKGSPPYRSSLPAE
jgi:PilZ domain